MNSVWTKLVVICAVGLAISACGVKSSPQPPDGATFPAQYPKPLPPIEKKPQNASPSDLSAPVVSDPKSFWQYPNTPPAQ